MPTEPAEDYCEDAGEAADPTGGQKVRARNAMEFSEELAIESGPPVVDQPLAIQPVPPVQRSDRHALLHQLLVSDKYLLEARQVDDLGDSLKCSKFERRDWPAEMK